MNEIVTVTEFSEKYAIPAKLRDMYGWNTGTIQLDEKSFEEKVRKLKEVQAEKKRPVSVGVHCILPLPKKPVSGGFYRDLWHLRQKRGSVPPSRTSIISAQTEVSSGSILESEVPSGPPVSQCSILDSEILETSILDSDIHQTTQSSPPPEILSSVCDL